jgi:hypothetical protein
MTLQKGSAEAKAWGDKMRTLRNGKRSTKTNEETAAAAVEETKEEPPPQKKTKMIKGSDEAKQHMAQLRSLKKKAREN